MKTDSADSRHIFNDLNPECNMKLILCALSIFIVVAACETQAPDNSAEKLTIQELNATPAYAWYPAEMSVYTPSAEMVNSVRNSFEPSAEKIAIFVKPTCSCRGTTKLFPQIMKTLVSADVDMDRVEIWSMRSASDSHPYQPNISITELPALFVFKNDVVVAHILGADYTDNNADTLIANALAK